VLIRKEKVYYLLEKDLFPNWEKIIHVFYEFGYITGYKEISNGFLLYINYYKNSKQIDEIGAILKNLEKKKIATFKYQSYKTLYPLDVAFIRTKAGIITLTEASKKNIGGEFLFYIR